jgi:undecaprenyl diphosphate synthase
VTAAKIPQHLAIIMDGNGRWAQLRGKPRSYGHIKGTRVAKKIITECSRLGVQYLTLYAFSTENWLRPKAEVSLLMKLLQRYLRRETENLIKENIRFTVIGDLENLPADTVKAIESAMLATSKCTGLRLVFALSYGSRQEITDMVKKIAEKVQNHELEPGDIDQVVVNSHLSSYPAPDPDLIIRTSGEQRLSNFLMWQAAYSEFYFSETLWPDFTIKDLYQAFETYSLRQRRYGKLQLSDEELRN